MLQGVTNIVEYRSKLPQPLQRVPSHQPSLIRVVQGTKLLFWQGERYEINAGHIVLLPAGLSISFTNQPEQGSYCARQILLPNELPAELKKEINADVAKSSAPVLPFISVNNELEFTWSNAVNALTGNYDNAIKTLYCYSLLLAIHHQHDIQALYPHQHLSMMEKVVAVFRWQPDKDWQLSEIADYFAMSVSTLSRRLADEGVSFRQLLTEVRLCNALALLQERRYSILDIALKCGYQNQEKFSARFKSQFGLTPAAYMKTL